MKPHEYSKILPPLSTDEINALASDIKANGLQKSIVTLNGEILDGRNRFEACKIAGVKPRFEEFKGSDPLTFVISSNIHRRHLTASQKAAVAVELIPPLEKQAIERRKRKPKDFVVPMLAQQKKHGENGKSRDQAAEIAGSGKSYTTDAKAINAESPETFEKLKRGEINIQDAKKEVKKLKAKATASRDKWPAIEESLKRDLDSGKTIVVNVDHQHHITNYAREKSLLVMVDRSSKFGNVFILGDDGKRDEVIEKYGKHYLANKTKLMKQIQKLKGLALGCHCSPKRCHGDIIARIANDF